MAQKKALSVALADRRGWLHAKCTTMSIVQRCALVGLARSTHYYEPVPERPENLSDADDRRTVLEAAVLWGPADDGLVANPGPWGQPQVC